MTRDIFSAELLTHLPFLKRFSRKLVGYDHATADDLVQDTVERALKAWESFTPGTNMRGWLAFILRNAFLSAKRRSWRSVEMDDDWAKALPGPGNQYFRMELSAALTAISYLPPEQAEALMLIAEGEDYDTAAQQLGCEVGTLKSRVSRARSAIELYFNAA
ncbi:sigma-70 family RNA polymerase sigma factor [uncultured Brevundimonas sp.]|uniref:sigma-70 family RNA polymerase sigma factor n=1 Tax=uncultured Brevundimonas sp. TaxID=213418 RepID=UPI0025D7DAAB|nr:sigma-70 family RNA polymerase sigma factor [uncultured Brevundimonas sp.]